MTMTPLRPQIPASTVSQGRGTRIEVRNQSSSLFDCAPWRQKAELKLRRLEKATVAPSMHKSACVLYIPILLLLNTRSTAKNLHELHRIHVTLI